MSEFLFKTKDDVAIIVEVDWEKKEVAISEYDFVKQGVWGVRQDKDLQIKK